MKETLVCARAYEDGLENSGSGIVYPGIRLTREQLQLLSALCEARKTSSNLPRDLPRSFQVPRRYYDLCDLFRELRRDGSVAIREEIPRRTIDKAAAGNLVVTRLLEYDPRIEKLINIHNGLSILDNILALAREAGDNIEGFVLLPNFSPSILTKRMPKGVVIKFDPSSRNWWHSLARYQWPLERGVIVVDLSIDVHSFIDISTDVSNYIERKGAESNRALKWVSFYYDGKSDDESDDERKVFMVASIGPTQSERVWISEQLRRINRWKEAKEFIDTIGRELANRRETIIRGITEELGDLDSDIICSDIICNVTYVDIDFEKGLAVSGGVGLRGKGEYLYLLSNGQLIIYRKSADGIVLPLGSGQPGVRRETSRFSLIYDILFPNAVINSFEEGLKNMAERELDYLEGGYFSPK